MMTMTEHTTKCGITFVADQFDDTITYVYPLTACCRASAKGVIRHGRIATVCRACDRELHAVYGTGAYANDAHAFVSAVVADHAHCPIPDACAHDTLHALNID